jgi:hypothetical protein
MRGVKKGVLATAALCCLAALGSWGCSSDDDFDARLPPMGLSGTCTVRVTGTQGGEAIDFDGSFDLTQSGFDVNGTWILAEGSPDEASGAFSGAVGGITLDFTLTQIEPCDGTFTGSATVLVNDQVVGSFSGTSCNGDLDAEFFLLDCVQSEPPV